MVIANRWPAVVFLLLTERINSLVEAVRAAIAAEPGNINGVPEMKMKLFYASNTEKIKGLEEEVNSFLDTMPTTSKIFAVNTTSTPHAATNIPTVTITVWYVG